MAGFDPPTHGFYGSSGYGYITSSKMNPWNSRVYISGAVLTLAATGHIAMVQSAFPLGFAQDLDGILLGLYLVQFPILADQC